MPHRRGVLASLSTIAVSLGAGCVDSITARLPFQSLSGDKQEILDLFESGLKEYNAGVAVWESSTDAFNSSDYAMAIGRSDDATEQFEAARETFAEGQEKAVTADENDAAEVCQKAAERAGLMIKAARAGRKAARAAVDGEDAGTINEHVKKSQQLREEASQFDIPDTETFEATLEDG